MRRTVVVSSILAAFAGAPLRAQTAGKPELAFDLNAVAEGVSSSPESDRAEPGDVQHRGFVKCGNSWYFTAYTVATGRELWRTGGTPESTVLVKDIRSGAIGSNPEDLICCGSLVYFRADDGATGIELYKTDGTAAGTVLVQDINPGSASSEPRYLECMNGEVYFSATDGAATVSHGRELWKSDGSAAGTVLVRDILVGKSQGDPRYLRRNSAGNAIYFSASDGTLGTELWKTSGTQATTELVKDIAPGSSSSGPTDFVNLAGKTVFRASSPEAGAELWITGGTEATTVLLKDIKPGTSSSSPNLYYHALLTRNNVTKLYFAGTGPNGTELWATDGTTAGTTEVADIWQGSSSSRPTDFCVVGDVLFFEARDATAGGELWKYDGTTATRLTDMRVGSESTPIGSFAAIGNKLFFRADAGGDIDDEPYISDGTAAGTRLLKDINPLHDSGSVPLDVTELAPGRLLFRARDGGLNGGKGMELWESDGTAAGTKLFKDLEPAVGTATASIYDITPVWGDSFVFRATDGKSGFETWLYSEARGVRQLGDLGPGTASADGFGFVSCGDKIYWIVDTDEHGRELVESDGTAVGTKIHDLVAGAESSSPRELTCCGNMLFFSAETAAAGRELYIADPVRGTVQLLKDIAPGADGSSPYSFVSCGERLYFSAESATFGREIWVSDGTVDGTVLALDARPGAAGSDASELTCVSNAAGTRLVFSANIADTVGAELYGWDLRSREATLIKDIHPGSGSSYPYSIVCIGDRCYFVADDGSRGGEPWVSDGTTDGTILIGDLRGGSRGSAPSDFTGCGDLVFFMAESELWVTDGTQSGTERLDLEGSSRARPQSLTCCGGRVYFAAWTEQFGTELWSSDGTVAGTRLVYDLVPGGLSGASRDVACVHGTLYYSGATPTTGEEIWKLPISGASFTEVGTGCAGMRMTASAAPVLGQVTSLCGWGAPALMPGAVFLSRVAEKPLHVPFVMGNGCYSWSAAPMVLTAVVVGPSWELPLSVPNVPGLVGVSFAMQTYYVSEPVFTTNAVVLTAGL